MVRRPDVIFSDMSVRDHASRAVLSGIPGDAGSVQSAEQLQCGLGGHDQL